MQVKTVQWRGHWKLVAVGAQKKARQGTKDGEIDAEEIGKAIEKSNNKPKNYRKITSKYKTNIE